VPLSGEIESRIDQLEGEVRRLRRTLFILVAIALAGISVPLLHRLREPTPAPLVRGDTTPAGQLSVRDLRLVDGLGRTRLALRVQEGVPGLYLYSGNGAERARLVQEGLQLKDRRGSVQAHLGIFPGGTPGLVLGGDNLRAALSLRADVSGPTLALTDSSDTPRVLLRQSGPTAALHLFDEIGNERLGLAVTGQQAQLRLSDERTHVRALLQDTPLAGTAITFFDSSGASRVALGLDLLEGVVFDTLSASKPDL
jgi:hypothetical protein